MLTISLNDLRFFGYHGVYPEERIIGNEFIVNCRVEIEEPVEVTLETTVNYQLLFDLIKNNMQTPEPLLETICVKTGKQILATFPQVHFVSISIKKNNPPINSFSGSAEVCWEGTPN